MELVIPNHNFTIREQTVVELFKKYWTSEWKTLLNVGFRQYEDPRNHWFIKLCEANNIEWKILEIFKPNIANALQHGMQSDRISQGDIMDCEFDITDVLIFWHGPEHIKKHNFAEKLSEIEALVNELIIFGTPLGYEKQGPARRNKHERHVAHYEPLDWINLNYEVVTVEDRQPGHITAYNVIRA